MRFVTKAQLARMGKCTAQSVGELCRKGKKLFHAVQESGRIDVDDDAVVKWLTSRSGVVHPNELEAEEFEKMTVATIVKWYGNIDKLEGYIKTRKMLVETQHKQILMEASREELVSREFIGKACFGILEETFSKLLDMPKGMIERIAAILDTETPGAKQECEQVFTDEISKILKNAKTYLIEKLENENSA